MTEEELLKLPFYSVATPEPEVRPDLGNYRTILMDLLLKIRIKEYCSYIDGSGCLNC